MKKKVVVAMSGGVDSAVAAGILLDQGYEVSGVFMKNWSPIDQQSFTDCPWEVDQRDAQRACEVLGISFRSVNFELEYKERVVNNMLAEYQKGRTPNPDVMCNKDIKFDALMKVALDEMGADYIATGHYARVKNGMLYRGSDSGKDQSYFLWALNRAQLEKTLFPLSDLKKSEVRLKAIEYGLENAGKKDSQGICFIGHFDLKEFLKENLEASYMDVYLVPKYKVGENKVERYENSVLVGIHRQATYSTIGERAGHYVDNGMYKKARSGSDVPLLYVLGKDLSTKKLYITEDRQDIHMYSRLVRLEEWQMNDGVPMSYDNIYAMVRYQQKERPLISRIMVDDKGFLQVEMKDSLYAVALGQSLVLYRDNQVIGGGIIYESD